MLKSHQAKHSKKSDENSSALQPAKQISAPQSNLLLTPSHISHLQKTIGNRAVMQLIKSRIPAVHPVQASSSQGTMHTNGAHDTDVAQLHIAHDPPQFTPNNGRAGSVEVQNIEGKPLGPAANAPSVDVFGWPELYTAGHTLANPNANNSHYNAVRMHLWNGRLGGPGDNPLNLAPGPATTNSSMSAGPETAAKDAVDKGKKIWLRTEVSYQNSNNQANDFTSVIPNRMKMEWGLMQNGARGPARPPDWEEDIDQPAGALTPQRQQQYQAVNDPHALDQMLQNTSNQEKAQAYALVTNALKQHMILTYDVIYEGMPDVERAAVLGTLTPQNIQTMTTMLGYQNNVGVIYSEILRHLYVDTVKLQAFVQLYPSDFIKEICRYGGWDLMQHLGGVADTLATTDRKIFNKYPEAQKYRLLDTMREDHIGALLTSSYFALLEGWARARNNTTARDIKAFLRARISHNMLENFDSKHLHFIASRENQQNNRRNPSRNTRGTPYTF